MPSHQLRQPHRANYDPEGNIILPNLSDAEPASPSFVQETVWEVTEDDEVVKEFRASQTNVSCEKLVGVLKGVRGTMMQTTQAFVVESRMQYVTSFRGMRKGLKSIGGSAKNGVQWVLGFLVQPVWVIGKQDKVKEYSRGSLFLLDAVRFGGTFAMIFVALFVSLNYESFWKIISPYFNPIQAAQSMRGTASIDSVLRDKLMNSPSLATAGADDATSMVSFLPEVGPPDNRMIIPKLELNVPLVTPSFDSLLKEDWTGVEHDIQEALQDGVVHYPGTARPGQAGNFFVTGHSSYYPWANGKYKTVFARLGELVPGDEFWVYYGGDKHRYIISEKKEVKPSDVTVLDQPTTKRLATLMTCTPVGTTLRRLIVTAVELDPQTGVALRVGEHEKREVQNVAPAALPI